MYISETGSYFWYPWVEENNKSWIAMLNFILSILYNKYYNVNGELIFIN